MTPFRRPSQPAPGPPPRKVVVTRPAPPSDEEAPAPKVTPRYTREEIRAMLAVDETRHNANWGQIARRGAIVVVPVGAIRLLGYFVFGDYADFVGLVFVVASLVWVARPLFDRKAREWG